MNVHVVTTFSAAGYRCYGKRFVEGFLRHSDRPLICYHESMDVDLIAPNLEWRNLDMDGDRRRFMEEHGGDATKVGTSRHPNSQSIRFCHKVFALTSAARSSHAEWLVWMDADAEVTGAPDWDRCLPSGSSLAFLGRMSMPYTECGFVGYRLSNPRVRKMLEDMRSYYVTGEIFTRPRSDWHDSRCFDICRHRSGIPSEQQHNLSAYVVGSHVWPHTVLAKWSKHHKGPRRKDLAYGGHVD